MDWKIVISAFTAVFFAEMADKTQLVGIGLASKSGRPVLVWLGSVTAYIIVTAISVFVGALLAKYIKPDFIRYTGALLFVLIGILMLFGKI